MQDKFIGKATKAKEVITINAELYYLVANTTKIEAFRIRKLFTCKRNPANNAKNGFSNV